MKDTLKAVAVLLCIGLAVVAWVAWSMWTAPSCDQATRDDIACSGPAR